MLNSIQTNRQVQIIRIIAAWGLFVLGALMALKLGLMLWWGGETAWIIYAGKGIYAGHPLNYLVGSIVGFLGSHILLALPRNRARDWGRLAGRLGLLIFSVGLTWVAAEMVIRTYLLSQLQVNSFDHLKQAYQSGKKPEVHTTHPLSWIIQLTDDPHLVYDLQPNLDMDFGHHRVRTNKAGMRADKEYPEARLPNSVRIVGVGDSGMFGWNCEQGEDYLAVLEHNLNRRGDGQLYEALNFAVPGYNTQLEAETLRIKALPFRPDSVVVGWCDRDFQLPFFMLERNNFRRRDISFLYRLLLDRKNFFMDSAPVRFTEQRDFNMTNVLPEIRGGADVGGVRQALQNMLKLSRQHGFHLLVFGAMGKEILQLCRETGVLYYNTFEKIPVGKYPGEYAVHYMHPHPEGHRVLAEYLERELAERGWLKPRNSGPVTTTTKS
jgi:hypothetical protein